jgi:hypothetical protein
MLVALLPNWIQRKEGVTWLKPLLVIYYAIKLDNLTALLIRPRVTS